MSRRKEYMAIWRSKNRDKIRAYNLAFSKKSPAYISERNAMARARYHQNKKAITEKRKANRVANRDKLNAESRERYKAMTPEQREGRRQNYRKNYLLNKEAYLKRSSKSKAKWYAANRKEVCRRARELWASGKIKPKTDEQKARHRECARKRFERDPEKIRASCRASYAKNRDKRRAEFRVWYEKNKERDCQKGREWRSANKKRRKEYDRDYARKNPEIIGHKNGIKRALMLAALREDADLKLIRQMYELAKRLSRQMKTKFAVDHIIPLSRGGFHHEMNLQVLPNAINLAKFDNPMWQMEGYKSWRDVPEFLWPESLAPKYRAVLESERGVAA